MIANLFEKVTEAVTGFFGSIGTAITEGTKLIYDPVSGMITVFGSLVLCVVGVGVVYWGFRLIRSLIHLRG